MFLAYIPGLKDWKLMFFIVCKANYRQFLGNARLLSAQNRAKRAQIGLWSTMERFPITFVVDVHLTQMIALLEIG